MDLIHKSVVKGDFEFLREGITAGFAGMSLKAIKNDEFGEIPELVCVLAVVHGLW